MDFVLVTYLLVVQSIHHTEHGVGRDDIGASIGDDIRSHGVGDVLQLMEDVEAFQYDEQAVVEEGTHQSGIANPVGGVQFLRGIVLALVYDEIGGEI